MFTFYFSSVSWPMLSAIGGAIDVVLANTVTVLLVAGVLVVHSEEAAKDSNVPKDTRPEEILWARGIV